jgi:hypothetical protein
VIERTEQAKGSANCCDGLPFIGSFVTPPVLGNRGIGDENGTSHEGQSSDLDDVFHVHLLVIKQTLNPVRGFGD